MSLPRPPFQHRLFMALWSTAEVARQLARITAALHAECGGRKIAPQNQHITVVFLGEVGVDRVAEVQRAMQAAAGTPFELTLDKVEYRKRGGMLWARAM